MVKPQKEDFSETAEVDTGQAKSGQAAARPAVSSSVVSVSCLRKVKGDKRPFVASIIRL